MNTGWKADLIPRKPRAFSRSEFDRRQRVDLDGLVLRIAAREGILRAGRGPLDVSYVEHWVADLGLASEWEAVQGR